MASRKKPPADAVPVSEAPAKIDYQFYNMTLDDEQLAQSDVSSTAIREAVAQHLSLEKYVPQAVAQYIHDNNIYS